MGVHACRHPCWHRALIVFGTGGSCYATSILGLWLWGKTLAGERLFWSIAAWLVSTWLVKHLLQWRCQGHEPREGRWAQMALWGLASAALVTRDEND